MQINYNQFAAIRGYEKKHLGERLLMKHYLEYQGYSIYKVWAKEKLWAYALLFIPEVITYFFACIWDGGLKHFELPDLLTIHSYIYPESKVYGLCSEIWGEHNEENN